MFFTVEYRDSKTNARAGIMRLPHGEVKTPFFMPVATKGAVKTLTPDELKDIGYEIILANTYHLFEKPGLEELSSFGGLHNYMNWSRPILTDSGGYQVFSLHKFVKINQDGVIFRSLIDGKEVHATPESVIDWQEVIGSDISMVLDVCTPFGISVSKAKEALDITIDWARRCIEYWKRKERGERRIFGIIQGSFYPEFRKEAVQRMSELEFDGFAAGGLSVGEPKELMHEISSLVCELLPNEKPRYFMGLGDPVSIVKAIAEGYDMFDSAYPTRIARGGAFITKQGIFNIRNSEYKGQRLPLDKDCKCYSCQNFSAGYIRHLYMSEETLALRLLTLHNLTFMKELMHEARKHIINGSYVAFSENFLQNYVDKSSQ